jgi:hypothetical protein
VAIARTAARLDCSSSPYAIELEGGHQIRARSVVIASGAEYRKLDLADLPRFENMGVYYGAMFLDKKVLEGKEVVVVGGGNSAGQAAVYLSGVARQVHMLVRSAGLAESMSRYLIRRIEESPQITLRTRTEIVALSGNTELEGVQWRTADRRDRGPSRRHVFCMMGGQPRHFGSRVPALDDKGFVKTGRDLAPRTWRARAGRSRGRRCCSDLAARNFAVGERRIGQHQAGRLRGGRGSISIQLVTGCSPPGPVGGAPLAAAPLAWVPARPTLRGRSCQSRAATPLVSSRSLASGTASAQDAFEIQVYDSETARAGEPGLEIHLNHFFDDGLTHLTFEPHLGLTGWWEVGVYLQFVLEPTGVWNTGGFKLRSKWRLPDKLGPVGLALNIEVARVSKLYEPDGWGGELRPIVDARWGRLYLAFNPIVASPAGRGGTDLRPVFEPAFKVAVEVFGPVALGLEEYSDFGVIGDWLPPALQTHRLFVVTDLLFGVVGINFGVGRNLNGPDGWIVKAIVPHPTQRESSACASRGWRHQYPVGAAGEA